jgi:F0F1-type ATP synthase assembly protein I
MDKYNQILEKIDGLNDEIDDKQAKTLELDLLKRITIRLHSFDCTECANYLSEMCEYIDYLDENKNSLEKQKLKDYRKIIEEIKTHLQKEHGLIPEGYYLSIYMSIGMSIGLVFGLTVFDNLAMGLPIGMSIGLAIGAGIDADYKKKGKTI